MNYKKSIFRFFLALLVLGTMIAVFFILYIAPYRVLPILTYHSISGIENMHEVIVLKNDIFKKQMEYLFRNKYKVLSLKEALDLINSGKMIPPDCVVLTFDDEFADFYDQAFPIIKKYNFKVTLFVYLDEIGKKSNKLTWELLKELKNSGLVDVASHSLSHRPLTNLPDFEVKRELVISKAIIKEKLGSVSDIFSYPFGDVSSSIEKMVRESGYGGAVGTAYQRGKYAYSDIYVLRRIFVSRYSELPFLFRFMLSGYYVPTYELLLKIFNIKTPRDVGVAGIKNSFKTR